MKPLYKKLWAGLALLLVLALLVLLYWEHNRADRSILIGVPHYNADGGMAMDFTNSPRLFGKATDRILSALLNGDPLPGSRVPTAPPDAVMMVNMGGVSYSYSAWLEGNQLIYAKNAASAEPYYRITGLSGEDLSLFPSAQP